MGMVKPLFGKSKKYYSNRKEKATKKIESYENKITIQKEIIKVCDDELNKKN